MLNIDFPFHFDGRGQTALTNENEHIRDMIEQFLFTSPGERVNRPDFGSGILQLIFAANSSELVAEPLQFTVQAGLQQWLSGVVVIHELAVSSENSSLSIDLSYQVVGTEEIITTRFSRGITS